MQKIQKILASDDTQNYAIALLSECIFCLTKNLITTKAVCLVSNVMLIHRGVGSKFGLVRQILCQSSQHSVQL